MVIIRFKKEESYRYTTARMYPSYGGVFTKTFSLYEGEKVTYFITEKRVDGTEISTPSVTKTKEVCIEDSTTKYARINLMRKLENEGKADKLAEQMQQYKFLDMAADELFPMK